MTEPVAIGLGELDTQPLGVARRLGERGWADAADAYRKLRLERGGNPGRRTGLAVLGAQHALKLRLLDPEFAQELDIACERVAMLGPGEHDIMLLAVEVLQVKLQARTAQRW